MLILMVDPGHLVPALRASDGERERAADLLRDALMTGRLSADELDDRLRQVFRAQTRAELEQLVSDVLVPTDDRHPIAGGTAAITPGVERVPVRSGGQGTHQILSILSGSQRKGRWRLAESCSAVTVLGGCELDLSEVELASQHVELRVISVLGGAEILLPAGLNVEISELAILGGNEIDIGDQRPDPGGPVVHLRILSILGGAEVRRGPKLTRQQRRDLERSER